MQLAYRLAAQSVDLPALRKYAISEIGRPKDYISRSGLRNMRPDPKRTLLLVFLLMICSGLLVQCGSGAEQRKEQVYRQLAEQCKEWGQESLQLSGSDLMEFCADALKSSLIDTSNPQIESPDFDSFARCLRADEHIADFLLDEAQEHYQSCVARHICRQIDRASKGGFGNYFIYAWEIPFRLTMLALFTLPALSIAFFIGGFGYFKAAWRILIGLCTALIATPILFAGINTLWISISKDVNIKQAFHGGFLGEYLLLFAFSFALPFGLLTYRQWGEGKKGKRSILLLVFGIVCLIPFFIGLYFLIRLMVGLHIHGIPH